MAYDQALADRVRRLLGERTDVTERPMFGGLTFLVGGHMRGFVTIAPDGSTAGVWNAGSRARSRTPNPYHPGKAKS